MKDLEYRVKRQTCLSSSGVFCGGIEGTLLTIPLACISYSLDTLLALEYSLLLSSIIFLAIIGLILYNTHSHLLTAIKELSLWSHDYTFKNIKKSSYKILKFSPQDNLHFHKHNIPSIVAPPGALELLFLVDRLFSLLWFSGFLHTTRQLH